MQGYYSMKKRLNASKIVKVASYTASALQDMWATFSNLGATATITISLPAAEVGMGFHFVVQAGQKIQIDPNGTETIALPSTGAQCAAGKHIWADAVGESVSIECKIAGTWDVNNYIGTWTAEV